MNGIASPRIAQSAIKKLTFTPRMVASRRALSMKISLAHDRVREIGNAARVQRRAAAGKSRHREIETTPKEMHRAALADKAGAKSLSTRSTRDSALQKRFAYSGS